jgi:hypothetical protein
MTMTLLQACGGSDSPPTSDLPSPQEPEPSPSTGAFPDPFVRGSFVHDFIVGPSLFRSGITIASGIITQDLDSGAITTIDTITLSADGIVDNIAGDASYAIGRWVAGVATGLSADPTTTTTLGDSDVVHYIVFNLPSAFPASGNYDCTLDAATAPTRAYTGIGSEAPTTGIASAGDEPVTLIFGADGAHTGGAFNITVGDSIVPVPLPDFIIREPQFLQVGNITPFAAVIDAGSGNYALAVGYEVVVPLSGYYHGMAHLSCNAVAP